MTTITGLTAARMQEIIDKTIVDADVVGDDLILTLDDTTTINAGNVRGATGPAGEAAVVSGSYTPTWTGVVPGSGTGFLNVGNYSWVGGPDVGDVGLLTININMRFGATSPTFPSGSGTIVSIPSGFNITATSSLSSSGLPVGFCAFDPATAGDILYGYATRQSATTLACLFQDLTTGKLVSPNATIPFTWAAQDVINVLLYGVRATRV